jgi:hypothetical protein
MLDVIIARFAAFGAIVLGLWVATMRKGNPVIAIPIILLGLLVLHWSRQPPPQR